MSFLHPEFLYFMLIPLVALFALLLTQKEPQADFFSQEVMQKLRVGANTMNIKTRNILFLIIGFLMILALAQPVIDDGKIDVKAKSADIMIAIDISDSMLAQDVYPNRLKLAKQKALDILKNAPDERIGVMAFAKDSYLVSPLSFDTTAVSFLLSQLDTASITQKGTDFLSVLDVFASSTKNKHEKYLLILSDGGDASDFSEEIQRAKENHIVVFILGIGTKKGAPIKLKDGSFIKQNDKIIVSKLNENIASLATSTKGVYIQSTNSDADIKRMLKEIKSIAIEKELRSEEVRKYIPLFYYPIILALVLLLIATSSIDRKKLTSIATLFLLMASMKGGELNAGMLDFMELNKAKEAYENGDYASSAKLYEKYAQDTKDAHSYFNAGNAFYKQGKYKEAIKAYTKTTFKDKNLDALRLSNLGNAYAKNKEYKKAIKSYEESLKIKADKETKENLDAVKKLLKKQKEKDKKQKNKKDKKNKDDKQNQNKKDKKNKDDKQNQNKKDKKNKDNKQNKDKNNKQKNKDDKKQSNKKQDKKSDTKDNKQKKNQSKSSKDSKKDLKKAQNKKPLEKLKKDKPKKKNEAKSTASKLQKQPKSKMNDAEELKWLKKINTNNQSYLYKLQNKQNKKEKNYERPW